MENRAADFSLIQNERRPARDADNQSNAKKILCPGDERLGDNLFAWAVDDSDE